MTSASLQPLKTRLTARGWGMLVFSIAGIVLGRVFGLFEIMAISICLLLLFIFLTPIRWALSKISISCKIAPLRIQCYETSNLEIKLLDLKKFFRFRIEAHNIIQNNEAASIQDSWFSETDPESPNLQTINCAIETHKRGILKLGPIQLTQIDPFGLIVNKKQTNASTTLIVHPAIFPIKFPFLERVGASKSTSHFSVRGREFHSLRDYQVGDDTTQIHWKSSAKKGNLILKQFEKKDMGNFTISLFIDNRGGISEEIFEQMVSATASIANVCEKGNNRVQLLTACGKETISNGYQILDFLSQLNQTEETLNYSPLLTSKTQKFLKYPNSDLTLALVGELTPEDELQLQKTDYSSREIKFFFFGKQPTSVQPLNLIPDQQSFQAIWEAIPLQ